MIAQETVANQVRAYVDRVISGQQVACATVRGSCARHLRDLGRVSDPDFPYEFNAVKADAYCRFFPVVLRHSIGEWVGLPFELSDWQQFVVWSIFGWVQKVDGARRFRRAYLSVARKNGKSTIVAGMGLLLLHLDKEAGAQVFVGATKREQAAIIHREAELMTKASPALSRLTTLRKNNLLVPHTNSFMRPVSSDKPYDGLNPSGVLMDELHAWKEQHRKFYETITTGSASRRQPLFVTATTAGDDKSEIWAEENAHAESVSLGQVEDDRTFAFVARLDDHDDPFDESVWEKANPNLGVSVKLDFLKQQAQQAKVKIGYRNAFVRYHCNRVVTSRSCPITREKWQACKGELSDWATADAFGIGIDLGGRDDLASWAACARFPMDDGRFRYEARQWSFLAPQTRRDLSKAPWAGWLWNSKLRQSRNVIAQIRDEVMSFASEWGCTGLVFDPHNARQLGDELEQQGLPPIAMPQTCGHYNEPLKELFAAIDDGRFRHDGDPVLSWAASNLTVYENTRGEIMPDKGAAQEKIDPIVAVIMAFRGAYFAPGNSATYYENNPVEMA